MPHKGRGDWEHATLLFCAGVLAFEVRGKGGCVMKKWDKSFAITICDSKMNPFSGIILAK